MFRARADSGRRVKLEADQPVAVEIDGREIASANARVRVRSTDRGG